MMAGQGYNQFCPIAMAAEILCTRWTVIVLRELIMGSTRFNELRRGMPRMSPALLSKRLRELECAGVIARRPVPGEPELSEYVLTPAGEELKPVVVAIGTWGHRWIETRSSLENLDPMLLMWDIRRNIDPSPMPPRRSVVEFIFADMPPGQRNWWLLIAPGEEVDLCSVDPGFDVDLYLSTDLRTMTEVWMGYTPMAAARDSGRLVLTGDRRLEADLPVWFRLSTFARMERAAA
jgi:DNA-binding HxlR family transcriptional regulator